jgi:hypothetical protein
MLNFKNSIVNFLLGTIHCHERFIHEEWPRIRLGIQYNCAINFQRPPRFKRTNLESQGQG